MNLLRSLPRTALQQRLALLFALIVLHTAALHAITRPEETGTWRDHTAVEFGLGATATSGATSNSVSDPGFDFLLGVGYRLNERLSIPFEYNFSIHGVQNAVLQQSGQPNGYFSFNSFAVNPMWTFADGKFAGSKWWGGYLVGGGGISIKHAAFGYNSYSSFSCSGSQYNVVASRSSVQPMLDIGGGLTLRFHEYWRGRLFLDVRYMEMYSPAEQFPGFGVANTELIPITLGARF